MCIFSSKCHYIKQTLTTSISKIGKDTPAKLMAQFDYAPTTDNTDNKKLISKTVTERQIALNIPARLECLYIVNTEHFCQLITIENICRPSSECTIML